LTARVEACVLAAGRGRRMGFAKHMYALDGVPLLERVVRALRGTSATPIRVVLRPGDTGGAELVTSFGAVPLTAESADEGRAASIRSAVRATGGDAAGLLVTLADQPFLEPADFEALLSEFGRASQGIVRARYAGEPGTPVVFARAYFSELLRLEGRDGGRRVIAANEDQVRFVDLDPVRGRDLDTPEDLPARTT
jgi:CTP:molybdopterin cytidylyltransferase MocA